ncbi:MAG: D-cysteine desulfhydrase family protein [Armatimonadetes bacterium]|nr:D-cysteine desulfhydrase family protein [Armatimonadota bacterium]
MIPRFPLCQLPTPCHRLERLSSDLGVELWIKRDDLTGFAAGGNKGRKLEYLLPEILASGCDTVVSSGANQSNFIRQLAAACRMVGLRFAAVTMPLPFEPPAPEMINGAVQGGNLILDDLFGAEITQLKNGTWDELEAASNQLADKLEKEGCMVKLIPLGGSSVQGAFAFSEACKELGESFDHIVVPTSSGSTHAGIAHFFSGTPTKVTGFCADPEPGMTDVVASLCGDLDHLLGTTKHLKPRDIELDTSFSGPGYGVASEVGDRATQLLAHREGIVLDPVYTAKAFAGLLDGIKNGRFKGRILFWHTGGLPSLFAYAAPTRGNSLEIE